MARITKIALAAMVAVAFLGIGAGPAAADAGQTADASFSDSTVDNTVSPDMCIPENPVPYSGSGIVVTPDCSGTPPSPPFGP
jgi:hypothetical protein